MIMKARPGNPTLFDSISRRHQESSVIVAGDNRKEARKPNLAVPKASFAKRYALKASAECAK